MKDFSSMKWWLSLECGRDKSEEEGDEEGVGFVHFLVLVCVCVCVMSLELWL